MNADNGLDLAGATLSLAYVLLVAAYLMAAIWLGERATLRQLTWAIRVAIAAATVGGVNLVVQIASIPYDGIVWPLLWVFDTAMACALVSLARRRRSAKGDQVLAEAERTVRDFNPLGGERDAGR